MVLDNLHNKPVVLVGASSSEAWIGFLRQALAGVAQVHLVEVGTELEKDLVVQAWAVIVDAGAVEEVEEQVRSLVNQVPGLRVGVATASPTWNRARLAMVAGASAYFRKSTNLRYLRDQLNELLV